MSRRILCLILFIIFIRVFSVDAQYYQYDNNRFTRKQKLKPITLIDLPTANFLLRKHFQMRLRVYSMGGMLGGLKVKLLDRVMFGVTYGGQNIIGHGKVLWNYAPGVNFRYQLRFESTLFPALALGFNSQGYGKYYGELERYQIKSLGFYVVGSKNYDLPIPIGFHGGINYSDENKNTEKDINFFMGAHVFLDRQTVILWEYDLGINDNDKNSIGVGSGYMNAGIRVAFLDNFILELSIKNLLKNTKTKEEIEEFEGNNEIDELPKESRELKIIYYRML